MKILISANDGAKRPYDHLTTDDRMVVLVEKGEETWIGVAGLVDEMRDLIERRLNEREDT